MTRKTIRPIALLLSILVLSAAACQFAVGPLSELTSGAADNVSPTVQTIQISSDLVSQQEALVSLYEAVSPGVVSINVATDLGGGQASGWVYDTEGHIVTNYHVVQGATYIEVAFTSGFKAVGEVVGEDTDSDLAVIKVEAPPSELHPLKIGDSSALQVGQYVVAIGNPFGLNGSMSTGIVSSLGRSMESMNPSETGQFFSAGDLIQTDAAINPGNSGGPLLNLNGEVVGVNRAIRSFASTEGGDALNTGIGFAVSSNIVARVVPSLITQGDFAYPYLGISSVSGLSLAEAQQLGLDRTDGALIESVANGGPADEAGVQAGDFVTAIDGIAVKNFDELISYLFTHKSPGETVTLTLIRDEQEMQIDLVLGARP
ncbi:MAG: trypsin-like peptidase domain-containing protein [Chloroflexi bacterium]|nr:trypsin-like peptidase domain-containing protein [Chloroflexota bacterium]